MTTEMSGGGQPVKDASAIQQEMLLDEKQNLEAGEAVGQEPEAKETKHQQEPNDALSGSASQHPERLDRSASNAHQVPRKAKHGGNGGKAPSNKMHKSSDSPSPNAASSKRRKDTTNMTDKKSNVFASYKEVWMQQTRLRKLEAEAKMAEAKAKNATDIAEQMKLRREEADRMKREMELVMQARVDNSAELRETVKQMAASLHENAARNREDIQNKNREEAASYRASVAQMLAEKRKEWDKRQKELVAQAKAMNANAICDDPKMYWITRSKERQQKELDRLEMERRANEDELRRLKKQEQRLMRRIEQSKQVEEEERRRYETYLTGEYRTGKSSNSPTTTTSGAKKSKAPEKTRQSRTLTKSTIEESPTRADTSTLPNDPTNDQAPDYNTCEFDEENESPDHPTP
ncbi:Hypothetical protein DHA2_153230 [Giardia duodenalis]|uniref:Uncharacterized protein n=1 Tax=Giardia intestinalis TaxID=5741 RepID=V6TF78_GIAIN|nr:Hypothetical protein DHA2_153230 [Giardia intestinalis]